MEACSHRHPRTGEKCQRKKHKGMCNAKDGSSGWLHRTNGAKRRKTLRDEPALEAFQ